MWWLWSLLLCLPWLVPTHAQPWTAFHADAAMAVAALPLLIWALANGAPRFSVPIEALVLVGLALVPLLQRAFGLIDLAGDAWLATLYLLGLAAAVTVGARAQQLRPAVLPSALFLSFAVASVGSVLLMLAQWVQWNGLGTLLLALPVGARLSANVGQPNHLGTLLVWGLLALWWGYERRGINGAILWGLAAFLLAGVAATQSRAAALELLLLVCALLFFKRPWRVRARGVALVALGLWFVAVSAAWPALSELFQPEQEVALSIQERMDVGTRPLHWRLLADAIALKPWFGWGWNQIVLAQGRLAALHPATYEVLQYGHNIFLDLLVWNGVPIGVLAGVAIVLWCLWQVRHAHSVERVLMLLVVAVFLVHTMVELPHGYLLFLLPVGLMVGALHVHPDRHRDLSMPRAWAIAPFTLLAVAAVVVIQEYRQVEDAWLAQRFRAARIGSAAESPIPQMRVLSNLQALLEFDRTEPRPAMSTEQLALLRTVSRRYPSPGRLFRHAWALALNGDAQEAQRQLILLCRLHPPSQCERAKEAWMAKAMAGPAALSALWPPPASSAH